MTPILATGSDIQQFLGWPLTIFVGFIFGFLSVGVLGIAFRYMFPKIFVSEKDMVTSIEFEFHKDAIRMVSGKNIDSYKNISGYCISPTDGSYLITMMVRLKCPITINEHSFDIISATSGDDKKPYINPSFGIVGKGLSNCIIINIGNISIDNGRYSGNQIPSDSVVSAFLNSADKRLSYLF